MCDSCGCGQPGKEPIILKPGEESHHHTHTHDGVEHTHDHHDKNHDHSHEQNHGHSHERKLEIEQDVLGRNNLLAERNRGFFEAKNVLALNLVS